MQDLDLLECSAEGFQHSVSSVELSGETKLEYHGDNQVIIAQNVDDLEFILKTLNKAYKEGGQQLILTKQNLQFSTQTRNFTKTLKRMTQLSKFRILNIWMLV